MGNSIRLKDNQKQYFVNSKYSRNKSSFGRANNIWFPSEASRYVFLTDLANTNPALYNSAISALQTELGNASSTPQTILNNYEGAKSFLSQAIANEQAKEMNFLQHVFQEHKDFFEATLITEDGNLNESAIREDPIAMLKAINSAIGSWERQKKIIEEEIQRIQVRREQLKAKGDKVKAKGAVGGRSYTQALPSTMEDITKVLLGKGGTRSQDWIRAKVVETVLAKTVGKNGGLDVGAFSAMAAMLETEVKTMIGYQAVNEYKEDIVEKILESNNPFIQGMLEDMKDFQEASDNFNATELDRLNSKYGQFFEYAGGKLGADWKSLRASSRASFNTGHNQVSGKLKNSILDKDKYDDESRKILLQQLSNYREQLVDVEVNVNTFGRGSEIISGVIGGGLNGNISGTGAATTDAFLIAELTLTLGSHGGSKGIQEIITRWQKLMAEEMAASRSNFTNVSDKFEKAYKELERLFTKYMGQANNLKKAFILHETTKDYQNISSKEKAFSGGEAWNPVQFAKIITSLNDLGFKTIDTNWLVFALINTAQEAVGVSNKNSLERYLSSFATMLMFSDGITIAKEAAQTMNGKTTLNTLHLFKLNNTYFPASYMMQRVLDGLEAADDTIEQGVYTSISADKTNYVGDYLNHLSELHVYGKPRWETVRNSAIKSTEIQVKIMANFFDVLNQLLGQPNN